MGDVVMPSLGEDVQEGTIVRWLKSDGDEVSRGDGLVEIETDKASETYDAEDEGVLEIVAGEGASVAVGEVIARLGGGGNGNGATADDEQDEDEEEPEEDQAGNGEHPPGPATDSGDPEASPVARRMAEEEGIALAEVEGSGPGGKVVKADVEGATPASGKGTVEVRELTGVQRRLARRMAE